LFVGARGAGERERRMGNSGAGLLGQLLLLGVLPLLVAGEDPYRFFTWTVTSGDIYPLGVKQKVGPPSYTLPCLFSSLALLLC
jgi:hypothetical protein